MKRNIDILTSFRIESFLKREEEKQEESIQNMYSTLDNEKIKRARDKSDLVSISFSKYRSLKFTRT